MTDFESVWCAYPRKVSKKDAMKAWGQISEEDRFAAAQSLPLHIKFWEISGTPKEFLPYLASWLRGERWTDELEMPQTRRSTDDWMRSTAGIAAKAREVGIEPKIGEDWHSLKARILARAA